MCGVRLPPFNFLYMFLLPFYCTSQYHMYIQINTLHRNGRICICCSNFFLRLRFMSTNISERSARPRAPTASNKEKRFCFRGVPCLWIENCRWPGFRGRLWPNLPFYCWFLNELCVALRQFTFTAFVWKFFNSLRLFHFTILLYFC